VSVGTTREALVELGPWVAALISTGPRSLAAKSMDAAGAAPLWQPVQLAEKT
jgi:hypothetical protein